jgi:hypothetical protein
MLSKDLEWESVSIGAPRLGNMGTLSSYGLGDKEICYEICKNVL